MIDLSGKVSLITGSSRGIGRATAVLFAKARSNVAIGYRKNRTQAVKVAKEVESFGVGAMEFAADVSRKSQADRLVNAVIEKFGRIDILVNNAGIWQEDPIDGLTEERLRETIETNVNACFYTTSAVVPHMKRQKSGVIIYISSTAGQRGEAFHSPYAASKGALQSLTKSLAPELAEYNIRVNCVAPGWVETDMSAPFLEGEGRNRVNEQIPLGRVGTPDELAGPILFMASDMATFITGEILNVNGGAVLCG